ncbi:hypothetical protein K5V21_17220 [Clostridium sardiniense]|uniref:Uncharacterized protein n=1 Tax=Clostridium sardiniense TaxID=29369 RepID=A0ABS7L2C2_CLOSR|nr:hypothetical protein [Clostridium sardiniense]MBY0757174.1 hypothetical protein [Clostridium sardiniense]MDQ0461652.1 hypothetical protein [Clostridium sardiniense]
MESLIGIGKALLLAAQLGGGIGFVYCLVKAGYKCFGEKQHFSEAKGDLLRGVFGLVLVLGAFKLSDWIQTMVKF